MTSEAITSELQKLEPSAIIELFVVHGSDIEGGNDLYFHAGTNELKQNIVWQGQSYTRFPVVASGFEVSGQGSLPRPKLRISNFLSAVTALLMQYDDLIGVKVTRKRTLKKYLDAENFEGGVNPSEDDTAFFPDDIFFIDRKLTENRDFVEFELASAMDLAGIQLPRRQIIQNLCPWVYRSAECSYADDRYFLRDDTPTSEVSQDRCGKRLSSCKVRFGEDNDLPFGGMPGAAIIR